MSRIAKGLKGVRFEPAALRIGSDSFLRVTFTNEEFTRVLGFVSEVEARRLDRRRIGRMAGFLSPRSAAWFPNRRREKLARSHDAPRPYPSKNRKRSDSGKWRSFRFASMSAVLPRCFSSRRGRRGGG